MKRSPLRDVHLSLGAELAAEAGWEIVAHYGEARTGALAIREGAGVVDLTHRGWLRLAGADRVRFLQAMFTNDVALPPGRGTYGAFLNDKGRVVSDAAVFVAEDAVYLDTEAAAVDVLPAMLDRYVIMDDVTVTDLREERVLLSVQGPTAAAAVDAALSFPAGELDPLDHRRAGDVVVARHDRVGEVGFDLHLPAGRAEALLDALRAAGVLPVGCEALELCRVEAGVPRAFVDMDETTLFLEAAGERFLSRTKGCYLGQEVVVRALDRGGVKRRLRGLRLRGLDVPARGDKVRLGDREVGQVTSAAMAPALAVPVALALLHKDAWAAGTEVTIEGRPAVVADLPFYQRG